jgi:hypothetical protein
LSDSFGDFATQKEVNNLFKDKEGNKLSANEFMKKFGLDSEDLKLYGYENAEEFMTAFKEGMGEWTPEKYIEAKEAAAKSLISDSAEKYGLDEDTLKTQTALI